MAVLEICLDNVRAARILHDPKTSGELNAEQLYELVLRATEDQHLASKAASFRGLARMRNDLPA